jgi:predicted thioesterase
MEHELKPGIHREVQLEVGRDHVATHIGGGRVLVLSTPTMIGLMEITATEAVQPYLPEGHTTVGIHVDVRHLAATPLGMRVTIRAELRAVEGRTLTFHVVAEDEKEIVSKGTHVRAIIDVAKFEEKLRRKASDRPRSE